MFNNRANDQKPDQTLINNFQETFSTVVRPTATGDSSTGPNQSSTQAVRITPSLDDVSLSPTSLRKRSHRHDISSSANTFSHSIAGDLLTPSTRMNALFDEKLFDQFTNDSPGVPVNSMYHEFGGQYATHFPQTQNAFLDNGTFSPEGFKFPQEDGNTVSLSEVNKQDGQASHMAGTTSQATNALESNNDGFRYCVTLHAPTAMIKDQNEVPITYLNKGQTYILSIADSVPPPPGSRPARYRTSIRIIFDEPAQTIDPTACWQLWKQVRGTKDAQERGSDVQAVDCLDPAEGVAGLPRNQIQLERMSIDGFCCTWTADIQTGARECSLGVRFNFLSTDFTHSKGVKGCSVRLCAKTEMIASDEDAGVDNASEMCYCKVKLFRDHGAERKLHSDISQTEKSIKKLERETALSQAGEDDQLGKRKRGSISSVAKSAGHTMTDEDQRQAQFYRDAELHILGGSLTSNLPMTVLAQRAEPQDDPDLFPIHLPSTSKSPAKSESSPQSTDTTVASSNSTRTDSSSPSTTITEPSKASFGAASDQNSPQHVFKVPPLPAKLTRRPEIPHSGPAVCFYIRFHHDWKRQDHYHRALYLKERTVRDLAAQICRKQNMNPDSVARVLHCNPGGLKIIIDDDVVQQLPDGQDMMVEIIPTSTPNPPGKDTDVEIILSF